LIHKRLSRIFERFAFLSSRIKRANKFQTIVDRPSKIGVEKASKVVPTDENETDSTRNDRQAIPRNIIAQMHH
jgi:hypothetical protein